VRVDVNIIVLGLRMSYQRIELYCVQRCSVKKRGVGTPFPHQITKKTVPNSTDKVSILLQEVPHWILLFHCRLLNSSANLRVASTSVRSQPCFKVIVWTPHLQVTLLVRKSVGTRSHTKKKCGNAVPTPLHPWTLHLSSEATFI